MYAKIKPKKMILEHGTLPLSSYACVIILDTFPLQEVGIFSVLSYPKSMILHKIIKNQSFWGCFSIDSPIFLEYNGCIIQDLFLGGKKK